MPHHVVWCCVSSVDRCMWLSYFHHPARKSPSVSKTNWIESNITAGRVKSPGSNANEVFWGVS